MRKLTLLLMVAIASIMLASCTEGMKANNSAYGDFTNYRIVVIDSCEYIEYASSYSYLEVTHKGNCKFCAERNNLNK